MEPEHIEGYLQTCLCNEDKMSEERQEVLAWPDEKTPFSRNSLGNRKSQLCKAHRGFGIRYAGVCYGCKKRLHLIPFSRLDVKLIFELSNPDSLKTRYALTV